MRHMTTTKVGGSLGDRWFITAGQADLKTRPVTGGNYAPDDPRADWMGERLTGTFARPGGPLNPRLDFPDHDYTYGAAVPLPYALLLEIRRVDGEAVRGQRVARKPKAYDRRPKLSQYRPRVAKHSDAISALKARDRAARVQLAQDGARPVT